MARSKRTKTGGKARNTPRQKHHHASNQNASVRSSGAYSPPSDYETSTFSLRDAARNSEHPRAFWSSSGLSLRHRSMNFVRSSGPLEPTDDVEDEPPFQFDHDATNPSSHQSVPSVDIMEQSLDKHLDQTHISKDLGTFEESMALDTFEPNPPASPRHSPTSSVSSGEVVFVGRKNMAQASKNSITEPSRSQTPDLLHDGSQQTGLQGVSAMEDDSNDWISTGDGSTTNTRKAGKDKRRTSRRPRGRRTNAVSSSDGNLQAVLDDYVANMRANGEIEPLPESPKNAVTVEAARNGWTTSDIEDFDDLSTSDEVLGSVQQVLSKRHRSGNLQYLVIWENQTVDEARWILHSSLTMPDAATLIEAFEAEEKQIAEYQQQESESSGGDDDIEIKWSSESDSDLGDDEDDDFEDERDLIERRMARMTDEHIARLFHKQESLGMFSKDLQIFDGAEDFEISEDAVNDRSHTLSRKKRDQKRRKRQAEAAFDLEEDMMLGGDDYGDFDVMDRERPSLNKSNGAPTDPFLLGFADPELAQGLRDTWATDRRKKRLRKQEREELRAQGLIGRKNKFKPDLKAKYNEGMSMSQIEAELEAFLFNGQQDSLFLPPMSKQERKVIHDIANAFGLKSKSQGSNTKRFPVLYKTSKTTEFDDAVFERLRRHLHRRFLPRMDKKGKAAAGPRRGGAAGRGPGDIGYREGEVVGAAAPELGAENRGRAMLEKMGWSTGTALGALNNQGILKPIQHVVKNSRAGLG